MTIETQASSVTYQGNSATTSWTYAFLIPAAEDLVVSLTDIATDVVTELDPSAYSVTGLDDPDGGAVTYPLSGSPLTSGYYITIQRVLPLTQETDLTNQDGFYPGTIESALDNLCMQIQQVQEQINRAVVAPVGTTTDIPALIAAILGAAGEATAAAASAAAAAASAATVASQFPIGAELDWPGTAAPALWLLEYGQVVSQATYPELFAVLGTTYNTGGEGAGNFRLPDRRGLVGAGKSNMGGVDKANLTGGTVLGAILGGTAGTGATSTQTLLQANLPNVNFTHSGTTLSDTRTWATGNVLPAGGATAPGAGGITAAAVGAVAVTTTGGALTVSAQGSAASGGSATPFSIVQPTDVRNKIIFAGH